MIDYSQLSNNELLELAKQENIISEPKLIYPDDFINKIICGDCLKVMKDIPTESINCIITDPPYGIDYQSARRIDRSQWKPKIKNDKSPFILWISQALKLLKPNGCILSFYRWDVQNQFIDEFKKCGGIVKSQIIWDKEIHGMGDLKSAFAPQHESILFVTKGNFKFPNKRPHSVIKIQRVNANKLLHPNEKPVELLNILINSITKENDTVLDCFMGSGTTAVACKQLNRNFIGIELEQKYVDYANERINDKIKENKKYSMNLSLETSPKSKKYQIILADPPWSYNDKMSGHSFSLDHEYQTQDKNWIQSLKVPNICEKDCVLFLWVVSPMLDEGIETLKAWGFKYKTLAFCWSNHTKHGKKVKNLGKWTMGNVELCLLGVKGHPKRICKNIYQLVEAERTIHSKKPDEVRNRIVSLMGDLPRIELFARNKTEGWDVWGNEVESDILLGVNNV